MPQTEWIEPAEGFRMMLRASHSENPDLADQITAKTWLWFRYPKQIEAMAAEAGRGSAARDVEAVLAAFDLFLTKYSSGRIRSRGFLNGAAVRAAIDPT